MSMNACCISHTLSFLYYCLYLNFGFYHVLHCTVLPTGCKIFNKRLTYLLTYLNVKDTATQWCSVTVSMYITIQSSSDKKLHIVCIDVHQTQHRP